ncbi:MAG: N-acetyltransferase [Gammaproteobacteria bacterium]
MIIQRALKENATDLAFLINLAGEGIPRYLWSEMAEDGQDPMEVGRSRASREEGGFSYTNARVIVEAGSLQGMIVSYQQPDPYPVDDIDEYPEIVKPLVLLEAKAPGSWYINAIATFEEFRGKGVAQKLLKEAEEQATSLGLQEMSLIVASENDRAKSLYEHIGYEVVASLPVVAYPGCLHGGEWLLMVKRLKNA